jgi:thiol:disulfide interchange protein DsbD
VSWSLPREVSAGEIQWPIPSRFFSGHFLNFGYENFVFLMVPVRAVSSGTSQWVELSAKLKWLVCRDVCVPGKVHLSMRLPMQNEMPSFSADSHFFRTTRELLPLTIPMDWNVRAEMKQNNIQIGFNANAPIRKETEVFFLPGQPFQIDIKEKLKLNFFESRIQMALTKAEEWKQPLLRLTGLLSFDDQTYWVDVPISQVMEDMVLPKALLLAFLGGLILNLMPCVFPVLSLKALSLLKQRAVKKQSVIIAHGFFYTFGVLVSFWCLAAALLFVREGGSQLGWGFQLQSPFFVTFLCNILFLIALNLLGVFEVGTSLLGMGHSFALKSGFFGDFFTGILATVVATPCTAPFMGTALAFAATQPKMSAFCVFSMLGLGLASPYLVFSVVPGLVRILPRPGHWMHTFKMAMAFPLLGTVIWLIWVILQETHVDQAIWILVSVLILALGAWIFGLTQKNVFRWIGLCVGILGFSMDLSSIRNMRPSVVAPIQTTPSQITEKPVWRSFSLREFEEFRREGRPLFIDFTAAWCVTCQVNEKIAFTSTVMNEFIKKGVVLIRADWTQANPEITEMLARFGRNGVPLYVLYSPGSDENYTILPQVLTSGMILKEVGKLSE